MESLCAAIETAWSSPPATPLVDAALTDLFARLGRERRPCPPPDSWRRAAFAPRVHRKRARGSGSCPLADGLPPDARRRPSASVGSPRANRGARLSGALRRVGPAAGVVPFLYEARLAHARVRGHDEREGDDGRGGSRDGVLLAECFLPSHGARRVAVAWRGPSGLSAARVTLTSSVPGPHCSVNVTLSNSRSTIPVLRVPPA